MVDKDGNLGARPVTWNSIYHMLYIDNPVRISFPINCNECIVNLQVGTGFSFTVNKDGYSTNEKDVADNLYSCLTQFFTVFSEYQSNDFYLTGEVSTLSCFIKCFNSSTLF